jgi:hypothetical protein
MCKRWNTFANFLADVGPDPGRGWTLDRYPDNDGNYEPTNWRWATRAMQIQNSSLAKLSLAQVQEIRERYVRYSYHKSNMRALAVEFGIGRTQLSNIIAGRKWRDAS